MLLPSAARAQRTWDRGAGTDFWTDAANWDPDGLPTSADTTFFTDTGAGTVDLNGSSQPASGSLPGLTFNNATTGYTVQNGGTIFTNGVTNSSGAAVTNTISARIFTNNLSINSGKLVLSNGTNVINGPVSIAAGATLDILAPSSNSIGSVSLDGGTLVVRGGSTTTNNALFDRIYLRTPAASDLNPISNLFAIAPTATRNATFPMTYDTARVGVAGNDGANGNTGEYSTNTLGNTYQGGNDNNIETLTTGSFTAAAGTYTFGTRSDDGSMLYIDLNNNGSFADAGELIVDNNNDHGYQNRTGNVTLTAGTYNMAIGWYQGGCCDNNGLEVRYGLTGGLGYNDAAMSVLNPTSPLAGTSFAFTVISAANLSGSSLSVTANSVLDFQSPTGLIGNVSFNDGTSLTVQGLGTVATLGSLSGSGTATLNTGVQTTAGALSGFTTFTKGGSNSLTLATDAAGYSGAVVVTGGSLKANSVQALGNTTGNTSVQAGGQLSLGANNIAEPVSIAGTGNAANGALESSGANRTFSGPISQAADAFIVSGSGGNTLSLTGGITNGGFQTRLGGNGNIDVTTNGISGNGGLRKTESGTVNFNVASSYSGTTLMENGTLNINAALSGTPTVNVSGGTANLNGGGSLPAATAINVSGGTFNAGAAVPAAVAVNVTGGTYNANANGSLAGNNQATQNGLLRVTTNAGAAGVVNVVGGGRLQFDAGTGNTASFTTTSTDVTVTGNGLVHAKSGIADLTSTNIAITPLMTVTNNNKLFDRVDLRGPANSDIDPISNLFGFTPNATRDVTFPMTYDLARVGVAGNDGTNGNTGQYSTNTLGATYQGGSHNNIETLTTGTFTVNAGTTFTFGTRSDDGSTLYIDLNNNGSFADGGERIVDNNGNHGYQNSTGTIALAAGTYNMAIGFFQGGCCDNNGLEVRYGVGSGLGYNDAAMQVLNPTSAIAGTSFAYNTTNGGGGNVQVDFGSDLRARTVTGATNIALSGKLTLNAGALASDTSTLTASPAGVLDIGAGHTLTAQKLTVNTNTNFTKTGSGTFAVSGNSPVNLDGSSIVASGGTADLSNTNITANAKVTQTGLQGRLYVNLQIDPRNNAENVRTILGTAATNTRLLTNLTGPNGGLEFLDDDLTATFFSNSSVSGGGGNTNYTEAFVGTYSAQVTGSHSFVIGRNDDNSAIFLDANRNGVFESNEQVIERGCCNDVNGNTPGSINLTAGESYGFVIVNEDTGGGGAIVAKFQEPAGGVINAVTIIAPGAAGQNQFSYSTGGGSLQVTNGAILAVGGTSGAVDASLADAGILRYAAKGSPSSSQLGAVTVAATNATIDTLTNQDVSITGSLVLNGSLAKTGAGRLAINVAGTGAGAVNVTGGTLGGGGSVAGPVSVLSGGTINAGNSIGTFGTGNLAVNSSGTLAVEIDPLAGGQQADLLNVTGSVDVTGGNLSVLLSSAPTMGQSFLIVQNNETDSVTGQFIQGNIVEAMFNAVTYRFNIDYASLLATGTGNDIVLTNIPVPEPSTISLALIAGLGLVARRRRR